MEPKCATCPHGRRIEINGVVYYDCDKAPAMLEGVPLPAVLVTAEGELAAAVLGDEEIGLE